MTEPVEIHRSYSQLNTYRRCGEQYRLEKIAQVPQRPSAAAVAGTVIHVATEHLDNNDLTPGTLEDAVELADAELDNQITYWREQGYDPENFKVYGRQDVDWYRQNGIPNAVNAYFEWRVEHPRFILAVLNEMPAIEVPFNIEFANGLPVHGHIDRVFEVDNQLVPFDLKSGTRPKTDEQLGLYARALEAMHGLRVNWGFYLYNLKAGEAKLTPPLRLDHWTNEELMLIYTQLDYAIQQGIFIPHPGEECFHCPVINSCRYAQSVV